MQQCLTFSGRGNDFYGLCEMFSVGAIDGARWADALLEADPHKQWAASDLNTALATQLYRTYDKCMKRRVSTEQEKGPPQVAVLERTCRSVDRFYVLGARAVFDEIARTPK